jgi:hypothetical protein
LQEEDKKLYSASPVDSDDECRDDFSDVKIDVKDFENQEARLDLILLCFVYFTIVRSAVKTTACKIEIVRVLMIMLALIRALEVMIEGKMYWR